MANDGYIYAFLFDLLICNICGSIRRYMRYSITATAIRMEISPTENSSNFEGAFVWKWVPPQTMGDHFLSFAKSVNNVIDQSKSRLIINPLNSGYVEFKLFV